MVPNSSLNKVRQENMAAVSIPRLFFLLGSKFGQTFVGACPGSCLGRSCQPQLWHGRTNLPIQSCNRKDKWKESGTDKFPTKAWKARLLQCGSISVASVMLMQHAAHSGVKTYRSMQYAVCSTPHAVRRMSRWNPNDLTQIGYIPVVNGSERDGPNNTGPSQQKNQKAWVEENAGNAKTNVIIDKPRNISTESADDASEPGNHAATQIEDYNKWRTEQHHWTGIMIL